LSSVEPRSRRLLYPTPALVRILFSVVMLVLAGGLAGSCAAAGASTGPRAYHVSAEHFRFHGMPAHIAPGAFQISFSNREAFPFRHELVLISIPIGQSVADVVRGAKATGAASEDEWLHWGEIADVDTGAAMVGVFDLPAGHYAFACWEDGRPGGGTGPVHAALHMVYPFTVEP
jgi:hypothetical protein